MSVQYKHINLQVKDKSKKAYKDLRGRLEDLRKVKEIIHILEFYMGPGNLIEISHRNMS